MLCILCTLTSDQMLNIFDENGTKLNMCKIISTHFWLQPDPKLNNSKCICLSCWNTVASFHVFYEQIEKTHMEHLKHLSKESDQESNNFDSFSGLFSTVVKQESSEYSNEVAEQPEAAQYNDVIKSEKEEETQKSDPESESEVLLMKLSSSYKNEDCDESKDNHSDSEEEDESTQYNDNQQSDFVSDSDSEYSSPKKKAKTKNSSTKNEDGIKRLSCKEFDSFIKKNMDLSCNICAKSVDNFFDLKEHFNKIHKTQVFVTCCDKQWNSRFSLVHHLLLHQDPDMYKCKKCSRVLANKKSFRNHMNTHVTQELVHECTKCNKKFSSIPKLEKHMNSHSRRYTDQICEQCGKVCHSKQSLNAHQKREHLGFVKQRVQCTKCGVYLADASTLRFHMKYLHPKTKVVNECHLCGKISATAYGLKRHIQYMHTMKRIHKCTICEDKAFKTAQMLRPNPKLNNSKCICFSCWNTVASFHKFYEQIEKAHIEYLKHLSKESDQESNNFDSFSDLFTTVVKQESSECFNEVAEQPEAAQSNDVNKSEKEKETHHADSESESEVSLMKLSSSYKNEDCDESKDNHSDSEEEDESTQYNDNQQSDFDSDSDSEYSSPKKKAKTKNSSTKNEDGIKRLSCKEFDSFIKKNMELSCSLCSKPVDNFFDLKEHFNKIHKTQAFVTCCDKQWNSRFSLVHHLLLHQDPDLYKCKKCNRVLANKRSFQNHMQSHVTQERIHECTKCNKKFSSIPKLEKHMSSHNRKYTDQICEQCGKVCHSKQSLSAHQKREHMGFVKQRVQCTKCGAYLSDTSTLHFHMKYQHPKTKVVNECHLCGKISATAYGLKRHIQYMHTMKRIHKCTICEDKAFKTAQILRNNYKNCSKTKK